MGAKGQARRKIRKHIQDRYAMYQDRGTRLSQDDLDYVTPHLAAATIRAEERAFIDQARKALSKRRRAVRLGVGAVVVLLVAFATTCRVT